MKKWIAGCLIGVAAGSCFAGQTQPDDGYTIKTTLRLAQPYDVKAMNDEFQSARLLSEANGVGTFEIIYRPFHVQTVGSNPNWRKDDAKMVEYLRPRPCANWDEGLRAQILKDLKSAGIDPSKLDDKTLVEQVSNWAMNRSKFNDQFGLWMVEFDNGKPTIPANLKSEFDGQEPKGLPLQTVFNQELYGKGLYETRTHGACTSSSTYLATILRAVGIPTRIILTVPACDPNDSSQVKTLVAAIRHHKTAEAIRSAGKAQGFVNHVFNEVWVGGKWVRLNYNRLGQPIVDAYYGGLLTHVYTAKDVSEVPFAKTWGARYALQTGPKLSSVNPYQLVAAKDELKPGTPFDNPEVKHLKSATIIAIVKANDPDIPNGVSLPPDADAFLRIKEWIHGQNYMQLRDFVDDAAWTFPLEAPGHPSVDGTLTGLNVSDEHGGFQGFAVKLRAKLDPGTEYKLIPHTANKPHTWIVPPTLTWKS